MPQAIVSDSETASTKTKYKFYYEAKENSKTTTNIFLDADEEDDRRNDYAEIKGMKEHHSDQHDAWTKAGNFYNIVQSAEGSDSISRFAVGLSRTIIEAGHSMMNEGEPEGAFKPIGPSERKIGILWDALVKHNLHKSNWPAHQSLWTADLLIFGSSPLEAYQSPVIRRPNEEMGLFLIRLATQARVGLRHRSIWYSFRNANVLDPDEVPSCAWEEIVTHGSWIARYAGRKDFVNTDQIAPHSKYKLTWIANELENTLRCYCLPFGVKAESSEEIVPPEGELGYPVYRSKLTTLNPLGMCPLSFGIFNDQLTRDYKQHSLYGMGIPQLIEGMEMIMEGLFNMTIDNLRYKNTVPVGYQPYQGQTEFPDFDNIGSLESGRVYHGTFSPMSLGIADIQANTVMWEWINNLCIWLTGLNFQQLGGDTSKTAYEFSQRLKANSQRMGSRLKGLENGPLKRSWTLLLANSLAQITKDEWENVTETQAKDIAGLISSGKAATNDYEFENGNVVSKKFVEYFPVENYKVSEKYKNKQRMPFDTESVDNTLQMTPKKGETGMVAAVPENLFPNGQIAQMLAFTTDVVSKTMLGDLSVQDQQAMDAALNLGVTLMPVVPNITSDMMFTLWKQRSEKAGLDMDEVIDESKPSDALKKVKSLLGQLQDPYSQQGQQQPQQQTVQPQMPAQTGQSVMQQPSAQLQGVPQGM